MLRTLLLATALLATTGAAYAHDDHGYGRVISTEPYVSVSIGGRHLDGFRVLYESGGNHYWTHSTYRPGPVILLPQHEHHVRHIVHYRDDDRWDHDWERGDRRDRREHRRKHHRHGHH